MVSLSKDPAPKPPIGVDADGNPITKDFQTALELKILNAPVLRSVDWRGGAVKACFSFSAKRAAQVQRCGTKAPVGEACNNCGLGMGPFASCCVLITGGDAIFSGGCAACNFHSGGKNCSFRKAEHLPEWILKPLHDQNPNHPLVKAAPGLTPKAPSTPVRGDSTRIHSKRRAATGPSWAPLPKAAKAAAQSHKAPALSRKGKVPQPSFSKRWYASPVEDNEILLALKNKDFPAVRKAYRELSAVAERINFDRQSMEKVLTRANELSTPEAEDQAIYSEDNPFLMITDEE
jgi:hypothetical protein